MRRKFNFGSLNFSYCLLTLLVPPHIRYFHISEMFSNQFYTKTLRNLGMSSLYVFLFLLLCSGTDCIKVVRYRSSINGSFSLDNFSLEKQEEWSLCLRVFSYNFSVVYTRSLQSLVTVGTRTILGVITNQAREHTGNTVSRYISLDAIIYL